MCCQLLRLVGGFAPYTIDLGQFFGLGYKKVISYESSSSVDDLSLTELGREDIEVRESWLGHPGR